jgi:hypothetical protein
MTPAEAVTGKTMREDLVQATVQPAALGGSVTGAWMPIETAPHETTVLLYSPPVSYLYDAKIETGWASSGNRVRLPNGVVSSTMSWHGSATHWMPLPAAPGSDDRTNAAPDLQRQNETDSLRLERDALLAALTECEEFFDERADADQPAGCDSPIPNDEMRMLVKVRAALSFQWKK